MRKDVVLQQALKEEISNIKENFWPRLLELATENEREVVRNLTILFMDLTGFSKWKDEELAILQRWGAAHPNMEGDSLRISFKNATVGLACACMIRNVLVGAGFDLRIGVGLGEVSIVHNVTLISAITLSLVLVAYRSKNQSVKNSPVTLSSAILLK